MAYTSHMPEPARKASASSYDQDFAAWAQDQAHFLKTRSAAGLDWHNLAEEIGSLGKSQRQEIRSRLLILLLPLLKWPYQPDERSNSWRASVLEQRQRIADLLDESPSLKSFPAAVIDREYRLARLKAAGESGLPLSLFPVETPYSISDVLSETFFPDD
jgi:hypothetical protein